MTSIRCWLAFLILVPIAFVRGDQVEMLNGDRYAGAVLSMSADTVFIQSDVLGQIKIPRSKVSTITFGAAIRRPPASANPAVAPAAAVAGNPLSQLAAHTNLIDGIRKQFLSDAGPEANGKFDDLMSGLISGKIDLSALRAQAKTAADQLRAMKKDAGGEGGVMLDAYLGILDKFLSEEAPPPPAPATNSAQGTIIIR